MKARGHRLVAALERLADTFVDDSDPTGLVCDLAEASLELLPIAAAAVLLADRHGRLRVPASTDERARLLVEDQIRAGFGPALHAFHGDTVLGDNLETDRKRWLVFTEQARIHGFECTYAFPMQLRAEQVGVLQLFAGSAGALDGDDVVIAHALSNAAAIGILHSRALADNRATNAQLQTALHSRIVIEQAKGILAQQGRFDMDTAFRILRAHARHTRQRLVDLATAIIEHTVDTEPILARAAQRN